MSNLVKANEFSVDEVSLIKDTICKGANDIELKLFLHQCKTTGLNPLARQIYSVERKEYRDGQWKVVRSIQVSIDGFRLIAERSGKYAGQTESLWCGEDGVWKDAWLSIKPPVAAKVGVMRTDFKEPCWGVARFDAYCQRKKEGALTHMWANMGDVMIAKCAEALALRKAFPQELSGLYTTDEMAQADIAGNSVSPTSGEVTAKQAFGSAKAMKERWTMIRDKILATKTSEELDDIFVEHKADFTTFRTIDEDIYSNLVSIGTTRRAAIMNAGAIEGDQSDVPAYIRDMDELMNQQINAE